jgi:hypothetical protein
MYSPPSRDASKAGCHILGGDPTRNKALPDRDIVIVALLFLSLLPL